MVTDAARKAISDEGYDPLYGARPLKRVIQQRLQNPLATEILKGNIPAGSGVRIDFAGEEYTFTPMAAPPDGHATPGKSGRRKQRVPL